MKVLRPLVRVGSRRDPSRSRAPARSVVIPVFNGAATIGNVVTELVAEFDCGLEIVLVNDGSQDDSEQACRRLVERFPQTALVQLERNVGEQRAVLAGLGLARGHYIAIIDDDGQQTASDARRMFRAAEAGDADVVFGRYRRRRHPWHRRVASYLYNRTAGWLFARPPGLYLSSFKVISRSLARELSQFDGPFLNLDALIFRSRRRWHVIDVQHRPRLAGKSRYSYRKLIGVWLETLAGYSRTPGCTALAHLAACALATRPRSAPGPAPIRYVFRKQGRRA